MEPLELKRTIREQAHANRKAQENKDELSQTICRKFAALDEFTSAKTVMAYIDVRTEVRTRGYLPTLLASGKRIVVPYCVADVLELFLLEDMDELSIGMYKILEPKPELRDVPGKKVDVKEVDLIMVPGVAFDKRGRAWGTGSVITTSCWNMPGRTRHWWRWHSNARFFPRFRRNRTTFSWTRSSPSWRSTRGKGGSA